jgi:adenosylmethionine-8-amino-7-oxononanoate aminotransferase
MIDSNDLEFDRSHLWHPYTSMRDPLPAYPVVAARGAEIELADGRQLVDGMSSWWAAIHGYNHPVLNEAAAEQMQRMSHVMFGGITHEPAIGLGRRLVHLLPEGLDRIFLCDSGSVAVEVAIKMALQYWIARGQPQRQRLMTLQGGYHGDTFMAMSVCDPETGMHEHFAGALARQLFAPRPTVPFGAAWDQDDIGELAAMMEMDGPDIAALILEPIVQGAGGMWFYHPEFLHQARALCDAHDVLLICDEIATGFGRTGRLFASEHAGVAPDIICVGKALTGGVMSLAATAASRKVAKTISADPATGGAFMHGPTFMGNPLACAVANASIDLLTGSDWQRDIRRIESALRSGLEPCRSMAGVADVRVLGAIGVVEMEDPVDVADVQRRFVDAGVWVRPFGRLVYLMPPYVTSDAQLETLTGAVCGVVGQPVSVSGTSSL